MKKNNFVQILRRILYWHNTSLAKCMSQWLLNAPGKMGRRGEVPVCTVPRYTLQRKPAEKLPGAGISSCGGPPLCVFSTTKHSRKTCTTTLLLFRCSFVVDCLFFILTLNLNLVSNYHGVTGCKQFLLYQYYVRVIDMLS